MARFQDLSAELVLGILGEVLPEDVESIALASKRVYQLAIPRLEEHRRLRKQYTNFRNSVEYKPNHWHHPGGLLADLLCKVVSDARTGLYVKKLKLYFLNYDVRDGWKPDEIFQKHITTNKTRLQQDSKTRIEIIEEAIRAIEIIPTEEVDEWLQEIRRGNEDGLLALLLLYAPKLHTLKFVAPFDYQSSYLLKTIQRVVGQGSSVKPYLSHLKHVDIDFTDQWESLDFVRAFMSLPSLTSIKTNNLFVDGRTHEAQSAILPQPSNVMDLSFQNGSLPQKVFSELLRGVENLRNVAYSFSHPPHDQEYEPAFDCLAVIHPLVVHASHTLEHLELGFLDTEIGQIASMRGFRALREIEFETSRCLIVDESNIAGFVGALPITIERIAMRWDESNCVDGFGELTEAFLGFIRESKTQLPHLRTLHVTSRDEEEYDALWGCFTSDATAQMNTTLSFDLQGPNDGAEIPAWADNVCICGQDCYGNDSD